MKQRGEIHLCADEIKTTIKYKGKIQTIAELLYRLFRTMPHGADIGRMAMARIEEEDKDRNESLEESET